MNSLRSSISRRLLLKAVSVAGLTSGVPAASRAASGTPSAGNARASMFHFEDWAGPVLRVWTYTPDLSDPGLPLVFIMHGQGRNASEYRDQWIESARTYRFAIAAPEFSRGDFPQALHYNLGNLVDANGAANDPALWSFASIEPMFDAACDDLGLTCQTYSIYGHSAGAQFVHRYLLCEEASRVRAAVSANAGWYTRPDIAQPWPFGVKGTELPDAHLVRWLARPLTILLGSADTEQTGSLNQTAEAMAQGPNRLARGRSFMEAGLAAAEARGVPFNWRLGYAPLVGHDNIRMAPHAVQDLV